LQGAKIFVFEEQPRAADDHKRRHSVIPITDDAGPVPSKGQLRETRRGLKEPRFAEIPATSRQRYIGDRFSYMEEGRADLPPVLLLHGIDANSLHWRYQLAGLADRFRLIAWNAPGYLLSDNLQAETPSCRDYADALDDLLSALGIDGFDVCRQLVRHPRRAGGDECRTARCCAAARSPRHARSLRPFAGGGVPLVRQ
jgi:hypothetical protein